MTLSPIRALRRFIAVCLTVSVALATPAMMRASAEAAQQGSGHRHHHQAPSGSQSDCCEFCLTSCATAPTGAGSAHVVVAAAIAAPAASFPDTGQPPLARRPHSHPLALGPPTLHA
jgi:hypothetical protein